MLSNVRAIQFHSERGRHSVSIPLPGATLDTLDITKVDGELLIRTASVNRALRLPRRIAALEVREAILREGVLSVFFHSDESGDDYSDGVAPEIEPSDPGSPRAEAGT